MSLRALPLQFLNLGGEMMYIIDQRLRAQTVPDDRAEKVRNDILSIMLSRHFVDELFHPQPLYSKAALRTVFHKLAHASIMKLNAPSMDKLFDLMVMSLKHQVVLIAHPGDLLHITLNHLQSMAFFATEPEVFRQVENTQQILIQAYGNLSPVEWSDIRRDLLMFVQDLHVRVSIFLRNGIQDHFGNLIIPTTGPVPAGCEVPGTIRFFDPVKCEATLVTLFPSGGNYTCADGSFRADCGESPTATHLGLNIYSAHEKDPYHQLTSADDSEEVAYQTFTEEDREELTAETSSMKGRQELNLLAQLIGTSTPESQKKEFRLNLFGGEAENESESDVTAEHDVITIDGKQRERPPELGKIMGELSLDDQIVQPQTCSDDLLQLLDSA